MRIALLSDIHGNSIALDAEGYRLQHRRAAYDLQAVIAAVERVRHPGAAYIIGFMRGQHRPRWRPS
jgi:hypothetical protein